jgi:uncharacterized protein YndB with AHSA1/START domain
MTRRPDDAIDPKLDLVIERTIDVPPNLVWEAWTTPHHLKHWFCPKPWGVSHCEIDLRPGGIFHVVQAGPKGESHDIVGCYLEVVENARLIWTLSLLPGYRPAANPFFDFTAKILMAPEGTGTRYTTVAMHGAAREAKRHADMGFYEGWNTALFEQMVAYIKSR